MFIIGQVLSLKIRFNNNGVISNINHPYIIIDIDNENNLIELVQVDSLKRKYHKAAFKSNHVLSCSNPDEVVIDEDSFVQMDNIFKVDLCPELLGCRRQMETISTLRLAKLIEEYTGYQLNNEIDELKIVYMTREEICLLNEIALSV